MVCDEITIQIKPLDFAIAWRTVKSGYQIALFRKSNTKTSIDTTFSGKCKSTVFTLCQHLLNDTHLK